MLARADSETLADCGIKDGEQLTAESVSTAAATTASASAPLAPAVPSSTSSAPKAPSSRNDEAIPFGEGFVVPRIQDDDNSCLFRSIGYVCLNSSGRHAELRKGGQTKVGDVPTGNDLAV